MTASSLLERGREGIDERDWVKAFDSLAKADGREPLSAQDLEHFALAAHMSGHRETYLQLLRRAYEQYLETRQARAAARAAFWLGFDLASRGEGAQASAWLGRAQRSLDEVGTACAEQGYLLLPRIQQLMSAGRFSDANDVAGQAVSVARSFGDHDLEAFAVHGQGVTLLRAGEVAQGLRLLDEAMLAVTDDATYPVLAGIVYCSAISACRQVLDTKRMQEWTELLDAWCSRQSGLVPYLGECKVFRSELLQLEGDWSAALAEAEEALLMAQDSEDGRLSGLALYQIGGIRMLRGEYEQAEAAFREAHGLGRDPQPGLAELWLRQGKADAAARALQRALSESSDAQKQIRLLPTYIQALLDLADFPAARDSCEELTRVARELTGATPGTSGTGARASLADAISRECTGRMALATGEPAHALTVLRQAYDGYQELRARYEMARVRTLVSAACLELGDTETAEMELMAAKNDFARLAASPDLEQLHALVEKAAGSEPAREPGAGTLTKRELEVLKMVAAGLTNREMALQLDISTRTVDRHVSNIFDKLEVSSRASAAVRAVELGLTEQVS